MKSEVEVRAELKDARGEPPDYWDGYRAALRWVLGEKEA